MRFFTALIIGLCLHVALWASSDEADLPDATRAELDARVVRIYDGDTIEVYLGPNHPETICGTRLSRYERVRLLGIDAPELALSEYYAQEAKYHLFRLIAHRSVRLEVVCDTERDGYGRLLAYVYVLRGGRWIFVNGELVRSGAADLLFVGTERYEEYLRDLWVEAVANRRGMWGRYPGVITVADLYTEPLKYVLEGVTIRVRVEGLEASWDGMKIICEGGFRLFIPAERLQRFEDSGLLKRIVGGAEMEISGVLLWTPTGPMIELWGPPQIHRIEGA